MLRTTFFQLIKKAEYFLIDHQTITKEHFGLLFHMSHQVKDLSDYISHLYQPIDFDENLYFEYLHQLIVEKKSLGRIFNKTFFYNFELKILNQVFEPRYETEMVLKILLKEIENLSFPFLNYADLCTGSGAIGLVTSKFHKNLQTYLVDTNPTAILNAQLNAELLKIQQPINYVEQDWFTFLTEHPHIHIISANFPYVGKNDEISSNLVTNDPSSAIFAAKAGWYHFLKLIKYLKTNKHWWLVVLEINPYHLTAWKKISQTHLKKYQIEVIEDLNHLARVVVIKRK